MEADIEKELRLQEQSKMRILNIFKNNLIFIVPSFLLGLVGLFIGNSTGGEYNPPWEHYFIQAPSKEMIGIAYVNIQSYLEDPTGDILFVETNNGEVYSNTIFQSNWILVEPVPIWNDSFITECAPEWTGPTNAHMWDPPPVEKSVIDSAGVRFERPMSTILRCYVLLEDGTLEVWIHSGNAMDLLAGEILKKMYPLFGVVLGIATGVIITRLRKRAKSPKI